MEFLNDPLLMVETLILTIVSTMLTPHIIEFFKKLKPSLAAFGKGFHLVFGTYLPIGLEFSSRVLLPMCLALAWAAECLEKTIASNSAELGFYRSIPFLILALGISTIIHVLYKKRMF